MKAALRAIFEQAESALESGRYAEAYDLYLQMMLSWVGASDPGKPAVESLSAREMVALERLADLAALFGNWDRAAKVFGLMQELFEQAANPCAADYIVLKAVALEINRGFPRHAEQRLKAMPAFGDRREIEFTESGFAQWEAERHWNGAGAADRSVLFSRFYLEMGHLEATMGEYERAVAALKRGLFHCGPGAPDLAEQAIAPLWLALAQAALERGDLPSADVALQSLLFVNDAWQPGVTVQRLEIRGKLALLRGKLGAARQHFEDALKICERGQFDAGVAQARLNLAQVLIYLNQTRQASEHLLQARDTAVRLNNPILQMRADVLLRHATARGQSLADAVPIVESVRQQWESIIQPEPEPNAPAPDEQQEPTPYDLPETGNYLASFEERELAFHARLGELRLAEAGEYLDEISRFFSTTDSILIGVRLLVMESMLTYYAADFVRALHGFQGARTLLQHMELLPELWQVERFIGWCMARTGRSREADLARREAEQTLAALTETLSGAEQAIFMLNKWTAEEEYISGEINQLARLKLASERASLWRRPWLRWRWYQRLGALLDYADRHKGLLAERKVKGRKDVPTAKTKTSLFWRLLKHPRDCETFSFVVLPDRVLVAKAGWLSLDFGVSPLTRLQVREAVRRWHELILEDTPFGYSEARGVAQTLANGLQISALLPRLRDYEKPPNHKKRLVFVPDDSLHGLPFAALPHQSGYLIEHYAISLAYEWSPSRSPAAPAIEAAALAVGVTNGTADYQALPTAGAEAQDTQQWMSKHGLKTTLLKDDAATKCELLAELATASYFHIACHGTFEPNQPDCSGLVLVLQSQPELLSLRELSKLQLSHLQLAVLSACWSADSFILPGRWVITLPETFWRAGADSVLGCLWEVDDRVTRFFMKQFYHNLESMPRAQALRAVQLECMQNRLTDCQITDMSDPVYWAGFTLYGETGPLKLTLDHNRAGRN